MWFRLLLTYGMLCPIFPDVLEGDNLERLVEEIRPTRVEHVWAEPYNDRHNWEAVRDSYPTGSFGFEWFNTVYGDRRREVWSRYATELYTRLRREASRDGWLDKLRYLLYERNITVHDAPVYEGLAGVLLQSKPGPDGQSQNPHMAKLQN